MRDMLGLQVPAGQEFGNPMAADLARQAAATGVPERLPLNVPLRDCPKVAAENHILRAADEAARGGYPLMPQIPQAYDRPHRIALAGRAQEIRAGRPTAGIVHAVGLAALRAA